MTKAPTITPGVADLLTALGNGCKLTKWPWDVYRLSWPGEDPTASHKIARKCFRISAMKIAAVTIKRAIELGMIQADTEPFDTSNYGGRLYDTRLTEAGQSWVAANPRAMADCYVVPNKSDAEIEAEKARALLRKASVAGMLIRHKGVGGWHKHCAIVRDSDRHGYYRKGCGFYDTTFQVMAPYLECINPESPHEKFYSITPAGRSWLADKDWRKAYA